MMVSRSETARPLLTPGEVMQLPPSDEIVMVAGTPPIRASKARYYEDRRLNERIVPPPVLSIQSKPGPDDWTGLTSPGAPELGNKYSPQTSLDEDTTDSARRHQPELSRERAIEIKAPIKKEFESDPGACQYRKRAE